MSTGSEPFATGALRDALRALLARSPASERLLELLGYRDAGRAITIVDDLAHYCGWLRQSLAQAMLDEEPLPGSIELITACETFVRNYAREDPPRTAFGHIGSSQVVDNDWALRARYGFSSTRSIETFEELLRYLSGVSRSLTRVLLGSQQLVIALREIDRAEERQAWDALARLISEQIGEWERTADVLDRASHAVREVLTQTDDFEQQRRALAERAGAEPDESVARLVTAIAKVRSKWAWLVRNPASSWLTCLELAGDYRLRLGFADGLFREVELGEEYWSTTGLEIDPERFRSVRIDGGRNQLVWSNGFADSGERLHLAISEGRLAGTAIDPIGAYEIVPGRSIGPFALGMAREQVEDLHIRPMRQRSDGRTFFPLTDVSEGEPAHWNNCGATLWYDASGRCCQIQAIFSWIVEPPIFTMLGQVVNGMTYDACVALLRPIAPDLQGFYGSVESVSAGVGACKWEAGDERIMSVTVRPPERARTN